MTMRVRALFLLLPPLFAWLPQRALGTPHAPQELAEAASHLARGEYEQAIARVTPLLSRRGLSQPDQAEAFRIHGLALFQVGQKEPAERSILAYLMLEPDAHLDPMLVPPEAVLFVEDVRSRHAGELRTRRPRPRRKRHAALNLLPPLGQVQNGERGKAMFVGVAEGVLAATNVATFLVLRSNCNADKTCDLDGSLAGALKKANLVSGTLLIGVVVYGVVDGFLGQRRKEKQELLSEGGMQGGSSGILLDGSRVGEALIFGITRRF
ncbi:MAG: hypothetical protein HY698_03905 [Deltaproteobacteria bacterium]|nr:hypothetical protein [Deltaproteobacteria bacterium]